MKTPSSKLLLMSDVTAVSASHYLIGKQVPTFAQVGSISIKIEIYKQAKMKKKKKSERNIENIVVFICFDVLTEFCNGCSGANAQIPQFISKWSMSRRETHHNDFWILVEATLF